MLKKLLIILSAGLSFGLSIACMEKKEKEQKSISEFNKHSEGINQVLQSTGLIPDLCRMIGEYDGLRPYHQFDNTNSGHTDSVHALAYIPEIKCLASGGRDKTIKLWDLDKISNNYRKCIATFNERNGGHISWINALIYIQDIKCLISGSRDNTIKLWNLDKGSKNFGRCIATFDERNGGHASWVNALTYIPDIKYLASASYDNTIKLWDLDKNNNTFGKCIATFDETNGGHTSWVLSLAYITNIKCLASGDRNGVIKLWNLADKNSKTFGTCINTFDSTNGGHTSLVNALTYISNIKCLVSGSWDNTIKLWYLDKNSDNYNKCIATFAEINGGHTFSVNALTYIRERKCLASGSADHTIKLWDFDKDSEAYNKRIAAFDSQDGGHINAVYALTYIEDIRCLVSGSADKTIKLWINMADVLGRFEA